MCPTAVAGGRAHWGCGTWTSEDGRIRACYGGEHHVGRHMDQQRHNRYEWDNDYGCQHPSTWPACCASSLCHSALNQPQHHASDALTKFLCPSWHFVLISLTPWPSANPFNSSSKLWLETGLSHHTSAPRLAPAPHIDLRMLQEILNVSLYSGYFPQQTEGDVLKLSQRMGRWLGG